MAGSHRRDAPAARFGHLASLAVLAVGVRLAAGIVSPGQGMAAASILAVAAVALLARGGRPRSHATR